MKYLKIEDLKDGYLYFIDARNAKHGIWISSRSGFLISRYKFGNNFLFEEYHWDCVAFATVKPLREIEKSPFKSERLDKAMWDGDKEILDYLNRFGNKYKLLLEKEENGYCKVCGSVWYNCLCYHEDL